MAGKLSTKPRPAEFSAAKDGAVICTGATGRLPDGGGAVAGAMQWGLWITVVLCVSLLCATLLILGYPIKFLMR